MRITDADEIKVVISGKLHEIALDLLRNPPKDLYISKPIKIVYIPDAPRSELLKEIKDAHVLISRSETDVDSEILTSGKFLSIIARAAVGYGNINCELATELGILVVNTPGKNTNSAAELTLGLLLAVKRKIVAAHVCTSAGGWDRHKFSGTELGGNILGIVGLGNVGHRVAKFALGFDMQVIAYDPYISDEVFRKNNVERKNTLLELLSSCNILSVHVPLNKETKNLISETELRKLPKNSIVLNAARGGVINEHDLLKLLDEGYISGAGLDTFCNEPTPMKELLAHPNVVVTPHIGASTAQAQFRIGETVAIQVLKSLRGEIVDYPVNLPHIGIINSNILRLLSVLSEKIARLAAQIFDFQPRQIKLSINAKLTDTDIKLLKLSTMKGFLSHASDEYVSYVNAERLFNKMGLSLNVELRNSFDSHNKLLLEIIGAQAAEKISVGAVLYDEKIARLCSINEFLFETELEGNLIIMQNNDRPGFIGAVGTYLAKYQVNIAQFELSRNRRGGIAMSLIRIDEELEEEVFVGLKNLDNLISVRLVTGL